jgi:hypothetical protein
VACNQIESLKGLEHFKLLKYLDIHGNKVRKIEKIKGLIALKILKITDNELDKLEGFSKQTALKELDISFNRIGKPRTVYGSEEVGYFMQSDKCIGKYGGIECFGRI